MSRGVKDLRELINVSRLTHRRDSVEVDSDGSDPAGDSHEASRLSSASSGAHSASLGACGSDSGLGGGGSPLEPAEPAAPPTPRSPAAPAPGGARRRRSRGKRSLPPLQRQPAPSPPGEEERINFDALMESIDPASVTDWLERATVFAHELSFWCNEGVNFVAFADFWLSDFPDARKREIVQLEVSVLLDEMAFAFRQGARAGLVTDTDVQHLLTALFHEFPGRLLGPQAPFFFLDYLDVLSSERTNDYRLLLTDVRLSTRNRLFAQWFLSIRSFALLSVWSAVVGFFRELTARGSAAPVRPQTADNRHIPSASLVATRTIQAVSHGFTNVLDYYAATKKIDLCNFKDEKGRNLIFLAVTAQQTAMLRHLLARYPKQIDITHPSETGNTALHAAVSCGNLELVRILVEANADLNAINPTSDNSSPLHLAVLYGHSAIVAYLLEKGADVQLQTNGLTAADLAREFEQTYILELITRLTTCALSTDSPQPPAGERT